MYKEYELNTQTIISKVSRIKVLQMTCNEAAVSSETVSHVTMLPASCLCISNRHWITSVLWVMCRPTSHAFVSLYSYTLCVAWTIDWETEARGGYDLPKVIQLLNDSDDLKSGLLSPNQPTLTFYKQLACR